MTDSREPKPGRGDAAPDEEPEASVAASVKATDPTLPAKPDTTRERRGEEGGPLTLPPRYQVLGYLGGGGMGHVVRALDRELRREVAIKALDPVLHSHPVALERLQREARAIAALRHPAIVGIYDIDVEAGILVMELLSGGSLAELLQKGGALGTTRSLEIMRAVLEALAVTHQAGIVHRDVKPSNILLDADGRPKLCDFGIVHTLDSDLTQEGGQPGTPGYMAPEQLQGGRSDERADVYAAGVTLFEMLTGRRYKNEPTKNRQDLAATLRQEQVEPAIAAAVARAVAEDPDDRFANAREFLAAIAPTRSATSLVSRRASLAVAALVGLAFAGWGAWELGRSDDGSRDASAPPPMPDAVAFLPFENATGDAELEFTAHGVPRALESRLRRGMENATVLGYDELRDVVGDSDAELGRWVEVARTRGADAAVEGRIASAEGSGIEVAVRILLLERSGTVSAPEEIRVRGSVADLDGLIARAASRVAQSLFGVAPATVGSGRTHSLEALRGYQRGVDALRRADFTVAITELEEVVALEPAYPEAWYHLSIARTWYGGVGNRAAFETIDRALADVDGRREQTLLRAMRMLAEQRPAEAARLLEPLRNEYPRDRDVLYTLGEGYHHGGDVAAGLAAFRAALRVAPGFIPAAIHPIRVYRAARDEPNARECIALRRRYGQEDQAEGDEWLLDFALGRYQELLERPLPSGHFAKRDALVARLGALLVLGEDDRVRELLQGEMADLHHPVARWSAPTVMAAIAYRRGQLREAREWAERAAVWSSERSSPSDRGEARATLGIVRALAGDGAGANADLAAVESEQYPPRVPRAILVFRALVGRLGGRADLLTGALEAPDREVRLLAEGLGQEMRGDRRAAAATLALALDEPTEGYFDIVILDALARNRHAIGDRGGVQAACNDIERPAAYHPYREPAVAHCRAALARN